MNTKEILKEYYNLCNTFGKENMYKYVGSSGSYKELRKENSYNFLYHYFEDIFIENSLLPYWVQREKYQREITRNSKLF
jgi:hypothetical protein